jgi:membrane protein DedA with SNARE-associated domain
MTPFLIHYLILSRPLGYFLIFLGLAIEGDIVLLIIAFLTHQGFFDLGDMILVSLSGALVGDVAWLYLGKKLDRLSPFTHKLVARLSGPVDKHLRERPTRSIFISKFTYGLHRAVLVRLGQNNMSLKDFLQADVPAVLVWLVVVGGLGYLGGGAINFAKHYLRFTELGLMLVVIAFLLISHLSRHYSEPKL